MYIVSQPKAVIAISFIVALTACSRKHENYTVDYLYENDYIRTQVLEACKLNKQTSDNCKNANEAEMKKTAEATRNMMLQ